MNCERILKNISIYIMEKPVSVFYDKKDKNIDIIFAKKKFYFGKNVNLKNEDILFKLTFYYYDTTKRIGFLSEDMYNIINIFNSNKEYKIDSYYRLDDSIFVSDTAKKLFEDITYDILCEVIQLSCLIFSRITTQLSLSKNLYEPIICLRVGTISDEPNIVNNTIKFDNKDFIDNMLCRDDFISTNDYHGFGNSDVLIYLNKTSAQVLVNFYQWLYNDYRNRKSAMDIKLNAKAKTPNID